MRPYTIVFSPDTECMKLELRVYLDQYKQFGRGGRSKALSSPKLSLRSNMGLRTYHIFQVCFRCVLRLSNVHKVCIAIGGKSRHFIDCKSDVYPV